MDDLRDSLPEWFDEIIGFSLIIFGMLSFLALFDTSDAVVADTWATVLRSWFGSGSILVAGGLFMLGVVILLPRIGIKIEFPVARILAIEITFLCLLALLPHFSECGRFA